MADSPRRNTQANRQARRTQPYARPAAPEPQSTPSRLRSLLSYVSPFRSARKQKAPSPEPANDEDEMDDDERVKDEQDSADEATQFALHGSLLPRVGDYNQHAPPSPSPGTGSSTQRSLGSSLTSSVTMPNLAALASTSSGLSMPRFPSALARSPNPAHFADAQSAHTAESAVASVSSHATQELARFFQDKAERGEDRLSAIEQAGVLQLMQQAQNEPALPTAFTPNFRSSQPAFLSQSTSQVTSSAGSVFGGAAPSIAGSAIAPSAAKRRRPIYVGAGYSSRRRRTRALDGLASSQSESALSALAGPSTDGKRRRTGADRVEEDDIPIATLDDIVASRAHPAPASPGRTVERSPAPKPQPASTVSKFAGASASASTPAKPSPLWQVSSQSESATPTPPRKASAPASTPATATRAADLVLEVIRQEDEARRAATPTAPKGRKDAILNPYAGEENPLALAGRAARKEKPKPSSPKPAERVSKVVAEVEKLKEKEVSPLEQLERTMPAAYRRQAKRASPPPPPAPTPAVKPAHEKGDKKGKKPVAVVTLSSSDNEDDEMGTAEEEEPAEAEEDEDEEEDDQLEEDEDMDDEVPAPQAAFSFGAPSPKPKGHDAPKPAFSFGASSSAFSFAPSATAATAPAAQHKSAFSFAPSPSATPEPTDGAQALLALSAAASAPAPPVFPPALRAAAAPAQDETRDDEATDPRVAARALSTAQLPLARFSFTGVGGLASANRAAAGEVDKAREAVKDLVRAMGRGELPTFAF
ncbi:hypothetical protein JCM3770_001420 [Rhodotorula araucariae]